MGAFFKIARAIASALLLSARKHHALFADHRVVTLRFFQDEIMGMRMFGGGDNLRLGRAGTSQFDVSADAFIKQQSLLRHHGNLAAKIARGDFSNVNATDAHRAALGIVKAQQQIGQRCFTRTTVPDQRDHLAGFDCEMEIPQHRFFVVVESDGIKFDLRASGLERKRGDRFGQR